MKTEVRLLQERGMKEKDVRESIERATARARAQMAYEGKADVGHERVRDQMIKHAETDKQKGKI